MLRHKKKIYAEKLTENLSFFIKQRVLQDVYYVKYFLQRPSLCREYFIVY